MAVPLPRSVRWLARSRRRPTARVACRHACRSASDTSGPRGSRPSGCSAFSTLQRWRYSMVCSTARSHAPPPLTVAGRSPSSRHHSGRSSSTARASARLRQACTRHSLRWRSRRSGFASRCASCCCWAWRAVPSRSAARSHGQQAGLVAWRLLDQLLQSLQLGAQVVRPAPFPWGGWSHGNARPKHDRMVATAVPRCRRGGRTIASGSECAGRIVTA